MVTPDIRDRLVALRAELLRRGERTAGDVWGTLGQILANAAMLSVFWPLLLLYRRVVYDDLRRMASLSAAFGIVIVGAFIMWRFINQGPELIPIPFAAMLLTVLISGRVAMVGAMVLALWDRAALAAGASRGQIIGEVTRDSVLARILDPTGGRTG